VDNEKRIKMPRRLSQVHKKGWNRERCEMTRNVKNKDVIFACTFIPFIFVESALKNKDERDARDGG